MASEYSFHGLLVGLILATLLPAPVAQGDSLRSRCGYSPQPDAAPESYFPCVFSQRQGYISIYSGETTLHDFSPDGEAAGTYVNKEGRRVYRIKGLDQRGQLFKLPGQYLYVIWDAAPTRLQCSREELTSPDSCQLGDGNVGFALFASSGSSLNQLTLTSIGLEHSLEPQRVELDGNVYLAELADIDGNGWPEVYVYVSSAGSGSYGSLAAFAVNNGKSATPIYLPPLEETAQAREGYQGHDEFRIVESRLVRRFPIYRERDTNAEPTGGTRQIQYRLVAGEAGWQLEIDKIVDY